MKVRLRTSAVAVEFEQLKLRFGELSTFVGMWLMRDRLPGVAGAVLVSLVGVVLILAGALKLIGVGAEDMVQGLEKARLIQHLNLISVVAIVCGLLLLVPQTRMVGLVMASAYWGGAIVAHLSYDDSIVMPAVFQAMLWLGWFLSGRTTGSGSDQSKSEP